jgi:CheY-like chemotaxis protein
MKKKVLLIEDDQPVLDTLKQILESRGYFVSCANDATTALDELNNLDAPDWVLMDYGIVGLNTFRFVDKLRTTYPKSKIIISSGYPKKEIEKEFELNLVDSFISKPFNPLDLIKELQ